MFSLADAKGGVGDWKNIQLVVRTAFIELHGLVERQSATIQRLEERLLQHEASARQFSTVVEKRNPLFDDLDAKIRELRAEVAGIKGDCTEMVKSRLETQLAHIHHMLKQKLNKEEFSAEASKFATRGLLDLIACRLDTEFEDARRQTSALSASVRSEVDEKLSHYVTASTFEATLNSFKTQCVKLGDVQALLNDRVREVTVASVAPEQLQTSLQMQNEAIQTTKRALEASIDSLTEHCGDLNVKINTQIDKITDMRKALTEESDALQIKLQEVENRIQARFPAVTKTVEDLQERMASVERMADRFKRERFDSLVRDSIDAQLEKTISNFVKHEVTQHNARIEDLLKENTAHVQDKLAKSVAKTIVKEGVKSQLELEDRFTGMERLLNDTRTWFQTHLQNEMVAFSDYVEDANHRLVEKVNRLDSIVKSSDSVLSLPTARWLWKGKKYSSIGGIIWSTETCNTLQSNFIWDTGKSTILVCLAGCYRIDFVIFGKQRPTVQLHVNGEPVICAMSGDVAPYMYIKPKAQPQNTYIGQSLSDYIFLSENSKLQLIVNSDHDKSCVSGYLSLQKLW